MKIKMPRLGTLSSRVLAALPGTVMDVTRKLDGDRNHVHDCLLRMKAQGFVHRAEKINGRLPGDKPSYVWRPGARPTDVVYVDEPPTANALLQRKKREAAKAAALAARPHDFTPITEVMRAFGGMTHE